MTVKLTTTDTVAKILKKMVFCLPQKYTKADDSILIGIYKTVCELFKLNIDQANELYFKSFITTATGTDLDNLIYDLIRLKRKNDETDDDYRDRYYNIVFKYNSTKGSVREIVFDITGQYPFKIIEAGSRSFYWADHDLDEEEYIPGTTSYYDDVNEYTSYWGDLTGNETRFKGYIYLTEEPEPDILNELIDVLEKVRMCGTKIYLVFITETPTISGFESITPTSFIVDF